MPLAGMIVNGVLMAAVDVRVEHAKGCGIAVQAARANGDGDQGNAQDLACQVAHNPRKTHRFEFGQAE
jgi:hypothetical protein